MTRLTQNTSIMGLAVLVAACLLLFFDKIDAGIFVTMLAGGGVLVAVPEKTPPKE